MWANTYWWVKAILFTIVVLCAVGVYNLLGKPFWPDGGIDGEGVTTGDPAAVVDNPVLPDTGTGTQTGTGSRPDDASQGSTTQPLSRELQAVHQKLALARQRMEAGKLVDARKIAENTLRNPEVTPYSKTWFAVTDLISDINKIFMTSDAPCPEKIVHVVSDGESLWTISRKYDTTVALIQKINGLDETNPNIYSGQTLSIFQADWHIEVSKTHYILVLFDGDRIMRTYYVGIGRQDRTPVGTFMMTEKIREPPWTNKGRVIPFGHPENVLGTRWMKIEPIGDTNPNLKGYGIHGTWEPESIGTAASNGCIRMKNEQVEELFSIIPQQVPVTIHE